MEIEPTIDITPEQRKEVLELLSQHLPRVTVWAYGSRVKWTSRPHSDLDLVAFATPEQNLQVGNLREAFDESNLPFHVSLLVWDEMPKSFRKHIAPEYVVLVDNDNRASCPRWPTVRIKEIAEKVAMGPFGSSIKVSTFVSEGIPVISGKHLHGFRVDDAPDFNYISEEHAQKLANANVQRGDIIFTHAGNIGQVAYIPDNSKFERYVISQRQFYMRSNNFKAIPEFLTYYFSSPHGQHKLLANASQVGVPSIAQPVTYLRTIEIPLPPISQQCAIAHILGTLDDKIELNRRMNETLEAMARAIFKDWFVDFGPTRAKAEGRPPYLPPEIWDLFPDTLDGEGNPIGWRLSEIGKEVDVVGGSTPSTKESAYWEEGKHHWATPKDLSKLDSPVLLETGRKITDAGITNISSGLLPIGTVLLSSRAPVGYLAVAEIPTAVNQGFIAMVCKKLLSNLFTLFWCYENLDYIKGISSGSTFAEISKRVFRPIPVLVPTEQVLTAYDAIVRPIFDSITLNIQESTMFAKMRDLLLPKLLSGEIQLCDAERTGAVA